MHIEFEGENCVAAAYNKLESFSILSAQFRSYCSCWPLLSFFFTQRLKNSFNTCTAAKANTNNFGSPNGLDLLFLPLPYALQHVSILNIGLLYKTFLRELGFYSEKFHGSRVIFLMTLTCQLCCSSARQSHAFDEGIVAWRVISKQILLRV
jgi:hypothetical protein